MNRLNDGKFFTSFISRSAAYAELRDFTGAAETRQTAADVDVISTQQLIGSTALMVRGIRTVELVELYVPLDTYEVTSDTHLFMQHRLHWSSTSDVVLGTCTCTRVQFHSTCTCTCTCTPGTRTCTRYVLVLATTLSSTGRIIGIKDKK